MDAILSSGIDFILFVQAHGTPASDRFFAVFTMLGARGYLLLVPLVLWCFDYKLGVRVALAMACTLFVNTVLKEWIGLDRPFAADDRIVSGGERGFSMPSGHAQLVVVFWGLVAHHVRRRWFWAVAIVWMCLMGFSRVYLGVHYPTDVIVGWAIGALTAWAFVAQGHALDAAWGSAPRTVVAGGAAAIAVAIVSFDVIAVGDHTYIVPGIAGMVLGVSLGALWSQQRAVFTGQGAAWQRAGRVVLGLAMGMPLLAALQRLGVPESDLGTRAIVAFDMAVFGVWLAGIAPWVFEKAWLVRLPDDLGE